MSYLAIGKRTFLELIQEVKDIIESKRYDVPSLIKTDLKAAEIALTAADDSFIHEMFNTLQLFLIPLGDKIASRDLDFFKRLDICEFCSGDRKSPCVCVEKCMKKCTCTSTCVNCSEILKDLDSKTFNAIKYIVQQAEGDSKNSQKQEDITVIFDFLDTIYSLVKKHKTQ